jgi:hypothetical protein
VVLAGQLDDREVSAVTGPAEDDNRAVLAAGGVLRERNPRPHDLARVRVAVGSRCIGELHRSSVDLGDAGVRRARALTRLVVDRGTTYVRIGLTTQPVE